MYVRYKPNEKDQDIIEGITAALERSLSAWYPGGAHLDADRPDIRSFRFCFILWYPITISSGAKKFVLVKIRRHPKTDALWQALADDFEESTLAEYAALEDVYNNLGNVDADFGAIRPLSYLAEYRAIVMEEFPSRTLRQILLSHRSARDTRELRDVARKGGRLLHYFHHHVHAATESPYSASDFLAEVDAYARRIETYSHGRATARFILDAFSKRLENVPISSILFSQTHADMTSDNILYSTDKKVSLIDMKDKIAPVYEDLGMLIVNPETLKPQIFSDGMYLSASLLKEYRQAILSGYFENEPVQEFYVKLFSALTVLEKWAMYEGLMSRYKGIKSYLAIPVGPLVTHYFQNVMQKYLNSIQEPDVKHFLSASKRANSVH